MRPAVHSEKPPSNSHHCPPKRGSRGEVYRSEVNRMQSVYGGKPTRISFLLLRQHKQTHNENRSNPVQCQLCDQQFTLKRELKEHLSDVHGETKLHKCPVCRNGYRSKYILQQHMFTHSEEKTYVCEICDKRFTMRATLQMHLVTHSDERPFECEQCDKRFKRNADLKVHLAEVHRPQNLIFCPVCNKQYRQRTIKRHMRTHSGEKPYTCDICGRKFSLKEHLKTHSLVHTGERPFACGICNKAFGLKATRDKHQLTH
ncbi:hypothetical protein JTE90_009840 [Oedothorax gibbosus]|uniref:C2H2-type domain-containing protein n=1 Tax=Oedothorax gibbosus TaxID=931172 RepID=A0AAV6TMX6_9ARAC|nr:hypothetical protein JTE90_009840 [Oedothorax gibbosus]